MYGTLFERAVVPAMHKVWMEENPEYLADTTRDYPALLSISKFILNQANLHGGIENHTEAILEMFRPLANAAANDPFYGQKSLSTVSNHIQEIAQKAIHGDRSKKAAKLTNQALLDRLNERYPKSKGESGG